MRFKNVDKRLDKIESAIKEPSREVAELSVNVDKQRADLTIKSAKIDHREERLAKLGC